jgi:hypothetical protein
MKYFAVEYSLNGFVVTRQSAISVIELGFIRSASDALMMAKVMTGATNTMCGCYLTKDDRTWMLYNQAEYEQLSLELAQIADSDNAGSDIAANGEVAFDIE